jgi:hypothetical protein
MESKKVFNSPQINYIPIQGAIAGDPVKANHSPTSPPQNPISSLPFPQINYIWKKP